MIIIIGLLEQGHQLVREPAALNMHLTEYAYLVSIMMKLTIIRIQTKLHHNGIHSIATTCAGQGRLEAPASARRTRLPRSRTRARRRAYY